ncbi:MAG TPA: hypothetical protein DCY32_04205 [Opitutae bacterium]|nr:hypothetical protein [Opitutae bacterium]
MRLIHALPCLALFGTAPILWATPEKPNYQDDILPILEQSCNSCHNPDKAKGGLDLTSMHGIMAGGSSGETAIPEDSANSLLYLLTARLEEPHMPPRGDKIEKAQLNAIKLWIDQGLLPTASGKPMKKKQSSANLSLNLASMGRPDTPPPLPDHLRLEPYVLTDRAFAPSAMASAPWSPLFAIASPKQVLLYHADNFDLMGILPYPEGFIESLTFSRNGELVLASGGKGGKSGTVAAWRVQTGERVLTLGNEQDSILTASISPDQSLVAIGGTSKLVKVFDLASGEVLYQIKKHSEWVTQVSFSPDGILLASADRNGGLHVWEAGTGNPFYSLIGHKAEITDLSWRADGNVLLSASEDGGIRTWEMINGKSVKTWTAHSAGILSAHFDEKGQVVSSGRDKTVKLWDQNGKGIRTVSGFKDIVMEARLSHDGAKIISGDWSGEIKVWNSADGKLLRTLSGNPPSIESRIAQARSFLEKSRNDYETSNRKLEPLVQAVEQAKSVLNQEKNVLNGHEDKVLKSQIDLKRKKDELDVAKKALAAAKTQRDGSQNEAASKKKLWDQANADGNAKLKRFQEMQSQVAKQRTELSECSNTLEQAKQIKSQNPEDADANKSLLAAQKSFDEKKKELGESENLLKTYDSAFRKAESHLTLAKNALASSNAKLSESSKILASAQKNQNDLIIELKQVETSHKTNSSLRDQCKVKVVSLEKELANKQKATTEPNAELQSARSQITRHENDLRFWQAQTINLERHHEITKLSDLKLEFESLEEDLEESLRLQNQATSNLEKASEAMRVLPEKITKAQELVAQKRKLLADKQRDAVNLQNRKSEKDNFLSEVEALSSKTANQTEVESSNETLAQAESKIKDALNLLKADLTEFASAQKNQNQQIQLAQSELGIAETALASALSMRESNPKVLDESKIELDRINLLVASRRKAVEDFRGRLNQQLAKTENLLKDYLAASPKR